MGRPTGGTPHSAERAGKAQWELTPSGGLRGEAGCWPGGGRESRPLDTEMGWWLESDRFKGCREDRPKESDSLW